MKRRYCHAGYNENGDPVFVEHGNPSAPTRALTGVAVEGKPVAPGSGLALVEFEEDGHAMMEDVVEPTSSGPAKVATDAYRRGWDKAFN
ncbi:MAG: hypothetical protein JO175_05600 [Candidatus Eremiobacteraeota bacterium]|nr:hypothetical protein [Candidatus Eremiobacteraeota bacterium]